MPNPHLARTKTRRSRRTKWSSHPLPLNTLSKLLPMGLYLVLLTMGSSIVSNGNLPIHSTTRKRPRRGVHELASKALCIYTSIHDIFLREVTDDILNASLCIRNVSPPLLRTGPDGTWQDLRIRVLVIMTRHCGGRGRVSLVGMTGGLTHSKYIRLSCLHLVSISTALHCQLFTSSF